MPKTDYDDPEIPFPRLQVRIQRMDGNSHWLHVWIWDQVGGPRRVLFNGKRDGSWRDAHEKIEELAAANNADVGADDIQVD
ncbi:MULTISPECIES: hypothetical protein [Bradyrhizobium]|uniref:hypothetical protein n=1 Tax=Bradyrhizobium TaxID=374 RepID=UPI00155E418C|nr:MULTISPECIES: hypothetical protein [Bradyrhizobium]UUO27438.1 hypothetical protein DCG74_09210 [Bradyrhizobium sp. WBAH42]